MSSPLVQPLIDAASVGVTFALAGLGLGPGATGYVAWRRRRGRPVAAADG